MNENNVVDFYPLSPMQQGMLFHSLYAPNSGVYVEQLSCVLRGDLDISAFEQTGQRVIDRHPVLRTAFVGEGLKEPVQIVHREVCLPLERQDWRRLAPADQKACLADFLAADRAKGFDLSQAPLIRLSLMRTGEDTHVFVWTHHHIILDGWSMPLLMREIFAFYEAFHQGEDPRLDPPRPYRDYIVWLRQQNLTNAEAFWQRTLQGLTAPTPLVTNQPLKNLVQDEQYGDLATQLPAKTTAAVQSLARQYHLTLSTLIYGAWALLLSRYTGEKDVVFGVTVSGRPYSLPGAETMIGLFINTLPLRVQVPADVAVIEWLKALQARSAEMRQFEYSPLVQIQGWSEIPRGVPLFESILVFENYPVDAALREYKGNLTIENIHLVEQTNYPLTIASGPGEALPLRIGYDYQRFDDITMTRLVGHYQTLLEGITANPEQHLASLPLLMETERRQMLVEWNATQTEYPQDQCIHQLLETHAKQRSDTIAVIFQDQHLTYRELNRRANQLAHYLQTQAVGPDCLIGIYMARSLETIIGILGTLKAGGAYVPLDPAYPEARLAFMLADTRPLVLLTQSQWANRLAGHNARVICLDTDWNSIAPANDENPSSCVTPANLAYVIYTSGSTGQPKGVLVPHRGLPNVAHAMVRTFELTPGDKILQLSSLSFDASVYDILLAWSSGATLCLAHENLLPDVSLNRWLQNLGVTIIPLTVSALAALPDEGLPNLRIAISGAEACPAELVVRWVRGRRFFNVYGPTEATIWATVTECFDNGQKPTIGQPIYNVQMYILDSHLQPVPVGVVGEMCIGGVGVTRGYLNSPALTAEKFIPNPFNSEPGAHLTAAAEAARGSRLYKTGDLARYLPDGSIDFLGRLDHQVKVRGFRIELGEIEAVLRQHPTVQETIALYIAREEEPDRKQLVAYIVPQAGQSPVSSDLRAFLKEKLPEYMIPSVFMTLEALPLTPNSKVDRRALPAPDGLRPSLGTDYVAPQTEMERIIAMVWQKVFQIEKVCIHDNFFELGGHSLLLIQVHSKLQEALGQELRIVELFQYPTISALARHLGQTQSEPSAFQRGHTRAGTRKEALQQQRQLRQQNRTRRKQRGGQGEQQG